MLFQFVLCRESLAARVALVRLVPVSQVNASDVQVEMVVVWKVLGTLRALGAGPNDFQVDFLDVLSKVA